MAWIVRNGAPLKVNIVVDDHQLSDVVAQLETGCLCPDMADSGLTIGTVYLLLARDWTLTDDVQDLSLCSL